jgi:hypothetical protein
VSDRTDRLRRAIRGANERADAAIGRTGTRLAGRTKAGERLRAFVNRDLDPALHRLQQDVLEAGATLSVIREYNDPTKVRFAIEGGQPEPSRETFRATLSGVIGRNGKVGWTLTQASGTTQLIEPGTAEAICDAILDAYTLALEGSERPAHR